MDDAAIVKAVLSQKMLHDGVVSMGVDSDVVGLCVTKIENLLEYSVCVPSARYAMDDEVWTLIIRPFSVVDS